MRIKFQQQAPVFYRITASDWSCRDCDLALQKILSKGICCVQVRLPHVRLDTLWPWCVRWQRQLAGEGSYLLLNASPEEVPGGFPCHGLHLAERYLGQLAVAHLPVLSVSCHGLDSLSMAAVSEVACALLSPVQKTATHPTAKPIGWSQFSAWVGAASLPVYALGGVGPDDSVLAMRHGGCGVAGIRAFW